MKIGIINNSLGNVGSVKTAFEFYKTRVDIVNEPNEIKQADMLVLAGVGNFKTAVRKLKQLNFWDLVNEEVIIKKKPILGICLGMQLFSDLSYEGGETKGFGWISGKVDMINDRTIKIPHIGWNEVSSDSSLFRGINNRPFYYMHSFHFVPDDRSNVVATTGYGNTSIAACLQKDNITGVQFHPEKSQGDGLRFIRNYLEASKK